ncbi:MAG TPA: hypothetical protein VLD37_04030 [Candidatus Bilamarchaeum sp.]|nr:hypothetical protein [Candidatus Bilamarchaeum sp.]
MKLFWKRPAGDAEKRDLKPEPLVDSWESRLLGSDGMAKLRAINEAGDKKDANALPALLELVARGDQLIGEAIEVIPLIILYNPGHPEIIALVPELERRFNPAVPSDEVWIFSAIAAANPGMFSGAVPMLLEMLESYAQGGETLALTDVVHSLGHIGDKSAIGPLEKLLASEPPDPNLREMLEDSLERLRNSDVFLN